MPWEEVTVVLPRKDEGRGRGLEDRSRRLLRSSARSEEALEHRLVELRDTYPDWGGRKLRALLLREGLDAVPTASTITDICAFSPGG